MLGKKIDHKCWYAERKQTWYKGLVTGIKAEHTDTVKTEFSVTYDSAEEDDDEWVFDLLQDLKKNDLIVRDFESQPLVNGLIVSILKQIILKDAWRDL